MRHYGDYVTGGHYRNMSLDEFLAKL